MTRRQVLSLFPSLALAAAPPAKFAHRHASMKVPGLGVFEVASRVAGLSGVELQVAGKDLNLWEKETLRACKREANRWGLSIPSLAGVWSQGVSYYSPRAEENIRKSVAAAEFLGSAVILVASFRDRCPNMSDAKSYEPVVRLLQKMGPVARDSGVVLGLETSLSPADDSRLVDLVGHPAVRVYYDAHNTEFYGHAGQSAPGLLTIGRDRLCQVHLKNESRLIEEDGNVNWRSAIANLKKIGYEGWYVFETAHTGVEQCVESTARNIRFVKSQIG